MLQLLALLRGVVLFPRYELLQKSPGWVLVGCSSTGSGAAALGLEPGKRSPSFSILQFVFSPPRTYLYGSLFSYPFLGQP